MIGATIQLAPAPQPSTTAMPSTPPSPVGNILDIPSVQARPHLVFQNVIRNADYAHVSLIPLEAPMGPRVATGLVCERVAFAGEHGLCLLGEHGTESRYFAVPFADDFTTQQPIPLTGSPTFARVSSDGRYGAASMLLAQATDLEPEAPTQTLIIDMRSGIVVADLEDFTVVRDGVTLAAKDRDLWGASFGSDSDRFFATLRTGGNTYLVEGSVTAREMVVVHSNASAPALSPDGSHVAYAKVVSNIGPTFRFQVLDLATMIETPLAETRSIDEQMEWLDDDNLLYGLATDTWVVPSDGTGTPRVFLPDGLSPVVVR